CPAEGSPPPASSSATCAPKRNAAHAARIHAASDASTPMKPRNRPSSAEARITASSSQSVAVSAIGGSRVRAHDAVGAELRAHLVAQLLGLRAGHDRAHAYPGQGATVGGHGLGEGAEAGGARAVAQRGR